MRRSACILILSVTVFFCQLLSQEQYPKKAYFDKENNKLYWPVAKQFFLKMSESADSSAPAFLVGSRDSVKGFNLYLSGLHSFRWIEPFKADTSRIYFIADGEKPRTLIMQKGKKYIIDEKIYYGKEFSISFKAQDHYSGIENVYVSIDSTKFEPAKDSLRFEKEKNYTVSFYAVDRVGNVGTVKTVSFNMDLTPPVSTFTVSGNLLKSNDVLAKNQSLQISTVDSLSGVKEFWYKFDQADRFLRAYSSISLSRLSDGDHSISFYAVDNVGVVENVHTVSFFIDNISPVPQISFKGDHFSGKNNTEFVSNTTVLKLDATDNKSGVEGIEYSFANGKYEPYVNPLNVPAQRGKVTFGVRAIDKKGNISSVKYTSLQVDEKAPLSKCSIIGPVYKNSDIMYINNESKISLSAADDFSGVKAINYKINDGKDSAYTEPFFIGGDGRTVIRYCAIDNVSNKEDSQAVVVVIDTTPPIIVETFSDANIKAADSVPVIRIVRSTSLFLAATDNASGVNGIWYSLDGKKEQKYISPLVFGNAGFYNIVIISKDNMGNRTEKKLTVEVTG